MFVSYVIMLEWILRTGRMRDCVVVAEEGECLPHSRFL